MVILPLNPTYQTHLKPPATSNAYPTLIHHAPTPLTCFQVCSQIYICCSFAWKVLLPDLHMANSLLPTRAQFKSSPPQKDLPKHSAQAAHLHLPTHPLFSIIAQFYFLHTH